VDNLPSDLVMADDHAIVRAGLRALIEQTGRYRILAECASVDEARAACAARAPQILLLDISLPGGGLNYLPEVRRSHPGTQVLVLSMHDNPAFVTRALQLGAQGYVSKAAAAEELISALDAARGGGRYISTDLRDHCPGPVPELPGLSGRESEVFLQLANGRTPKQVAADLGISVKTVYLHRASIREKLVVHSDVELHRLAQTGRIV
jgi:DNA-binding NarL/FixJ family response regulator